MAVSGNINAGFLGGTILSIAGSITPGDIVKTFILATIGAVASLIVSHFLKWCGFLILKLIKKEINET